MTHANTTTGRLGQGATDLDRDAYLLARGIRHAQVLQLGYVDEGCDCAEYIWDDGAWTDVADRLIRGAYEVLGWTDRATADRWLATRNGEHSLQEAHTVPDIMTSDLETIDALNSRIDMHLRNLTDEDCDGELAFEDRDGATVLVDSNHAEPVTSAELSEYAEPHVVEDMARSWLAAVGY